MSQNKYQQIAVQITSSEMLAHITSEDALGAVVRGHLYIEELVNVMLAVKVVDTQSPAKLDLTYANKVDLLCALGFKKSLVPPLKAIGKLRNRFAHDLEIKMQDETVANLYATFDKFESRVLASVQNKEILSELFGDDLRSRFSLWITFLHSLLYLEKVRLDLGEW